MKYLLLLFFLSCSVSLFADNYEPKDISELQAQYNLLIDLKNEEHISEEVFTEKAAYFKAFATNKFQVDLEGLELQQIVPAQRIDWIGSSLYIISALLVLLLLGPLLAIILKPLASIIKSLLDHKLVRKIIVSIVRMISYLWEPIAYITLGVTLYFFQHEYILLLSTFLLGSLISYSVYIRRDAKKGKLYGNIGSWAVTITWALIAYFFNNAFIGFMAVSAFISSIGFAIMMFPGVIGIGFKKDNAPFVLRLTTFTFFLSMFAWLTFYTNYIPALLPLREHLRVFEVGMVSLIPQVYFLGIGYITFFIYRLDKDWGKKIFCELLAITSSLFTLIVSLMYGISSMFWIGFFFMIWYAIDKYYELVYKKIDFVWAGLLLAAILGGLGYYIKNNLTQIMEVVRFLNL